MKEIKRTFKQIIKQFLEPVIKLKNISLKGLIPAIGSSFIGIIIVFLVKDITNIISNGDGKENLNFLVFLLVLFVVINYFLMFFTKNFTHVIMWPLYRKYLYKKYLNKYISLDGNETEKVGTGKLIAMIDKGLHSWVDLIVRIYSYIIPGFTFIVFSLIFIGTINLFYLIFVLLSFFIIGYLTYFLQIKANIIRKKRRDVNISIMARFVKILMSKFEILQNNKLNNEIEIINKSLYKNLGYNKKVISYSLITDITVRFLVDGAKIFIILFFGFGLWNNVINFGEFVSLMSIIYILDQILKKFTDSYIEFTKIFVNVEKLWDFFDETPTMKGYDTGKDFEYKKGEIEIKNLSYSYVKNKPVFENFNLKIKGAKVTAFVGNSGSGKSTLVKLIAGYIHPDSGEIIVDGQKLSEVNLKSYYKNIGYLTQEPSVFDGTILDNLTYAVDRELKSGELEKVLKQAKCEFVYDLENGLDTEIGERGVRLSGGQKQRLAIAKIMLKDPKIIILDEPTSALDSFSEEQITYAMHNLFKGRTVIIIAHRLQTVKEADDIILLENGEIKERGTHKELVKLKGDYNKMLELQSGF